jgi:hypothetical protein
MLWLKHRDRVLFRCKLSHEFELGTWDGIVVPGRIRDQFGYFVGDSRSITYEGNVCATTLPGTFAGLPAFCLLHPQEYREQLSNIPVHRQISDVQ